MSGASFFDGACGMCIRSRELLLKLNQTGELTTEPLQRPGTAERLGISQDRLMESVWWLDSSGEVYSGAEAANAAVSAGLGTPAAADGLPDPRCEVAAECCLPVGRRSPLPLPGHDSVLRVAPGRPADAQLSWSAISIQACCCDGRPCCGIRRRCGAQYHRHR